MKAQEDLRDDLAEATESLSRLARLRIFLLKHIRLALIGGVAIALMAGAFAWSTSLTESRPPKQTASQNLPGTVELPSGTHGSQTAAGSRANPISVHVKNTTSPGHPTIETKSPEIFIAGGSSPQYGGYNDVACQSADSCVAVGASKQGHGLIAQSVGNAGKWTVSDQANLPPLNTAICPSTTTCIAGGDGVLITSHDAGASWTADTLPPEPLSLLGLSCASPSVCLAVGVAAPSTLGYEGALLRSSDGGSSWNQVSLPPGTAGIGAVTCPTEKLCVAVGDVIIVSNDGGTTWSAKTTSTGVPSLMSVGCLSATTCIAVGQNLDGRVNPRAAALGVITTDGGQTWRALAFPPATATLSRVVCTAGASCLATGPAMSAAGVLLYQSDATGTNWHPIAPPPGVSSLSGVACPTATQCHMVGSSASQTSVITWTNGQWAVSSLPAS